MVVQAHDGVRQHGGGLTVERRAHCRSLLVDGLATRHIARELLDHGVEACDDAGRLAAYRILRRGRHSSVASGSGELDALGAQAAHLHQHVGKCCALHCGILKGHV
jgi:hypothetical protein